jgi:hypothetical protein
MNIDDRFEQASAEVRRQVARIPLPPINRGRVLRRRVAVSAVLVGVTALVGVTVWLTLPWSPGSSATSDPAPPSTATSLGTSTSPSTSTSVTTTAPQTTSSTLLPAVPEVATAWRLEPGDVLVANGQGVHLVRAGELVGTLVTTPAEVAVSDGSGAIVLQMPDPGLWPDHWPERHGGGRILWRVDPEGAAVAIYEASTAASEGFGVLRLYDVTVVAPLSPAPSVVFTEYQTIAAGVAVDRLMVLPLDGRTQPVLVPAETPGEGGVTGVGWQSEEERFLMSTAGDGGQWFSAWDIGGAELTWPTNPAKRADSPPADHTTLTPIPGTSLIAYITSSDTAEQSPSDLVIYGDLVIYNTTTGQEVSRVQVADPGVYVKLLHADGETVAITRITWSAETGYTYLPVLVFDLATQSLQELSVAGMATVVGSPMGS